LVAKGEYPRPEKRRRRRTIKKKERWISIVDYPGLIFVNFDETINEDFDPSRV
jgi:hypothetical protein